MSDKTIRDRGITTFTRPEPLPFDFDTETKKLELVQYYQYCKDNLLISGVGEQSRLALIRKTFNHLGGVGETSDLAMKSWLQSEIPSASTNLEELWGAYFSKHATLPDSEGVTYLGLSIEAGYRKFLRDFVGTSTQYTSVAVVSESVKRTVGKRITETVTTSESVFKLMNFIKNLSDSCTSSEALLVMLNHGVAPNQAVVSESHSFRITKSVSDRVVVREIFTKTGGTSVVPGGRTTADGAGAKDKLTLMVSKVKIDAASGVDSIAKKLGKTFTETPVVVENISYILNTNYLFTEILNATETVLLLLNKKASDVLLTSHTTHYGMMGYNGGSYNDYYYNA